jgi:hypothetical protein
MGNGGAFATLSAATIGALLAQPAKTKQIANVRAQKRRKGRMTGTANQGGWKYRAL